MNPTASLAEAKQFVESHKDEGTDCPCCAQKVKRYRRKITSAMAYGLILIAKKTYDWIHLEDYFKSVPHIPSSIRGDISKLKHWGLLQKHPGRADNGNSNGLYRITTKGQLFVKGKIQVPHYCFLFNDHVEGFSPDHTDIQQALGDQFNYSDLFPSEPNNQLPLL